MHHNTILYPYILYFKPECFIRKDVFLPVGVVLNTFYKKNIKCTIRLSMEKIIFNNYNNCPVIVNINPLREIKMRSKTRLMVTNFIRIIIYCTMNGLMDIIEKIIYKSLGINHSSIIDIVSLKIIFDFIIKINDIGSKNDNEKLYIIKKLCKENVKDWHNNFYFMSLNGEMKMIKEMENDDFYNPRNNVNHLSNNDHDRDIIHNEKMLYSHFPMQSFLNNITLNGDFFNLCRDLGKNKEDIIRIYQNMQHPLIIIKDKIGYNNENLSLIDCLDDSLFNNLSKESIFSFADNKYPKDSYEADTVIVDENTNNEYLKKNTYVINENLKDKDRCSLDQDLRNFNSEKDKLNIENNPRFHRFLKEVENHVGNINQISDIFNLQIEKFNDTLMKLHKTFKKITSSNSSFDLNFINNDDDNTINDRRNIKRKKIQRDYDSFIKKTCSI